MTQILSLPDSYDAKYLNYNRVFPLIDSRLQELIIKIQTQPIAFLSDHIPVEYLPDTISAEKIYEFKIKFQMDIGFKGLNQISNLSMAKRMDICLGCTQYIDTLYMRYGPDGIQVLEREYTYHERLNPNIKYRTIDTLEPGKPLIISQPFYNGSTHIDMERLLTLCLELNIPVHIDGAWITAGKNINIDFNHPAIASFAASMSKGYGLSGWNRIGVRWTKEDVLDAITVMNDFQQVPVQNVIIGRIFLDTIPPNYLWIHHGVNYNKICKDFNLTPTDSIHLAMDGKNSVGIESLLRYLDNV
jgi:hypothetical protein